METLPGWAIMAAVALLYCGEIVSQLPLLTRYLDALPPARRGALPRHPRNPRWAVFGSTRFFLAVFRDALISRPDDDAALLLVKRRMRRSGLRELLGAIATVTTWFVLHAAGWRPWS